MSQVSIFRCYVFEIFSNFYSIFVLDDALNVLNVHIKNNDFNNNNNKDDNDDNDNIT